MIDKWDKFAQAYNKPGHYEFLYRSFKSSRMIPVVGIRLLCCNKGIFDGLPDDIDKLDDKTWDIVQKNLIEDATNHGYLPCENNDLKD